MNSISNRIKELREVKNYSRKKLAELAGVSQPTIYNIENGKVSNITLSVGKGIARALDISFAELFEIEDSKNAIETELANEIAKLKNTLKDKEMIIDFFEKEKVTYKKDILHFIEEVEDTQMWMLEKNNNSLGLNSSQIQTIQKTIFNPLGRTILSFFATIGLIDKDDWKKISLKYKSLVQPGDSE